MSELVMDGDLVMDGEGDVDEQPAADYASSTTSGTPCNGFWMCTTVSGWVTGFSLYLLCFVAVSAGLKGVVAWRDVSHSTSPMGASAEGKVRLS